MQNAPLTRPQILGALQRNDETLRRYSVKRIGLFGSYARGEETAGSDIDFVVEFEKPTYRQFLTTCASSWKASLTATWTS